MSIIIIHSPPPPPPGFRGGGGGGGGREAKCDGGIRQFCEMKMYLQRKIARKSATGIPPPLITGIVLCSTDELCEVVNITAPGTYMPNTVGKYMSELQKRHERLEVASSSGPIFKLAGF